MPDDTSSLQAAAGAPFFKKLSIYSKMSGPGWLQAAVTLGGGSLAGSLYLGVIGGYQFLWLQPLAMLCGVIMLGAISWITLTIKERPFRAIQSHVSPILAWAWLAATVVADTVFCVAQFALGSAAMRQNLGIDLGSEFAITGLLALSSFGVVWLYIGEAKSSKIFDQVLKIMVAVVMLSFFGVVVTLAFKGSLDFVGALTGLIPNFSALFNPVESLQPAIDATGSAAGFWSDFIAGEQRSKIIAAFGSAVGINMTFLLPYSIGKKGWGKQHRELAFFDLFLGLFIPFFIATTCLVIASIAMFHASSADILDANGQPYAASKGAYEKIMSNRVALDAAANGATLSEKISNLPMADRQLGAMITNRDAGQLARSLAPLMGEKAAQWIFGIGVLAMAVSTMIIHQIMNGFAVSEAVGKPGQRKPFILGALIPLIAGILSPILWTGDAKLAIAIPASIIATTLLPLAYFAFILLFNSKKALKGDMASGTCRIIANIAMIFAGGVALFGSVWALTSAGKPGMYGLWTLALLAVASLIGFIRRSRA